MSDKIKDSNDKESKKINNPKSKNTNDPWQYLQWHIKNLGHGFDVRDVDMNVKSVWSKYQGKNIKVGVIDDGFAHDHPDLKNNYDTSSDYDALDSDSDAMAGMNDHHGTWVGGVISAEKDNNIGGCGVAPKSKIFGYRMGYGMQGSFSQEIKAFQKQYDAKVHVLNNSWGYGGYFYDNFFSGNFKKQAALIEKSVYSGRDYKGTVIVFAAGNDRTEGQNTNYHNYTNSRYVITVAAINSTGSVTSFSTPGASILVSAPGQRVYTTNRDFKNFQYVYDYKNVNGTSFAAPNVSGAVALILEANPNLGYRDVQEIIAYSARKTMSSNSGWSFNGANNWNGGGMHVNHDYGYGLIDTQAAVRLAETWQTQHTAYNERKSFHFSKSKNINITDNSSVSDKVNVKANVKIDYVEVLVNMKHNNMGDLVLTLVSPSGTRSILVDRPGLSAKQPKGIGYTKTVFTLTSTHFWSEESEGEWTLIAEDKRTGDTGAIKNWSLGVYGDIVSKNNTYIYTDEYAKYRQQDQSRGIVSDSNGGHDTLNFSAVSKGVFINLEPDSVSTVNGQPLKIQKDSIFECVFGTIKNDTIFGNKANNYLQGGDGQDKIFGVAGDNTIYGGAGQDELSGGNGQDRFIYKSDDEFGDVIINFMPGEKGDIVDLKKWTSKYYEKTDSKDLFAESLLKTSQNGNDVDLLFKPKTSRVGNFKKIATLKNIKREALSIANFDL